MLWRNLPRARSLLGPCVYNLHNYMWQTCWGLWLLAASQMKSRKVNSQGPGESLDTRDGQYGYHQGLHDLIFRTKIRPQVWQQSPHLESQLFWKTWASHVKGPGPRITSPNPQPRPPSFLPDLALPTAVPTLLPWVKDLMVHQGVPTLFGERIPLKCQKYPHSQGWWWCSKYLQIETAVEVRAGINSCTF